MHRASGDRLDAGRLHALLKPRAEVLIAEQQSPWLDVDGRDPEAFAREGDEFIEDGIPHVYMRRPAGV